MKKTLIAVACAAFISTGAFAKPASNHAPKPSNNHQTVHIVNHTHKPSPHVEHSRPAPHKHHHAVPAPVVAHHHHHNDGAVLLGDMIIAFAILASNAM